MTNNPYCTTCGHVVSHHTNDGIGPCGTHHCDCRGFNIPKVEDTPEEPGTPVKNVSYENVTGSRLVDHARRELTIVNQKVQSRDKYSDHEIEGFLKVVQAFADMGHSGGSAPFAIGIISDLLQFKPLTPLTDDPDEWQFHGEEVWGAPGGIWQSRRNSEAFSINGGSTYYLLSEVRNGTAGDGRTRIMHNSIEVSPDPAAKMARQEQFDAAPYDR